MGTARENLEERFRELSDEELLSRTEVGTLTELAQGIAEREIQRRGLELPAPASHLEETALTEDWVLLDAFPQSTEAFIVASFLEEHGIATSVADANINQMNPLWSAALGGIRVMVLTSTLEQARELIKDRDQGKFELSDNRTRQEPHQASASLAPGNRMPPKASVKFVSVMFWIVGICSVLAALVLVLRLLFGATGRSDTWGFAAVTTGAGTLYCLGGYALARRKWGVRWWAAAMCLAGLGAILMTSQSDLPILGVLIHAMNLALIISSWRNLASNAALPHQAFN